MNPRRALILFAVAFFVAFTLWGVHFERMESGRRFRVWLVFFAALFSSAATWSALWLLVYTGVREAVHNGKPLLRIGKDEQIDENGY